MAAVTSSTTTPRVLSPLKHVYRRRSCLLKALVLLTFFGLLTLYVPPKLIIVQFLHTPPLVLDSNGGFDEEDSNHSALILDTAGCKIPKLNPFDKSVLHLLNPPKKPFDCGGDAVFLVGLLNGSVVVDEKVLNASYDVESPRDVSCRYRAIYRDKEKEGSFKENYIKYGDSTPLQFGAAVGEEFLEVSCALALKSNKTKNYIQWVALVPDKPDVEERVRSPTKPVPKDPLDVILIGIDSTSKLNFLRQFNQTRRFLTERMRAFEMKGYNKVGDNTFPNLTPLLTGHFVEHYWNETVAKTMFFDHLDLIWKEYAARGYRTFYTEDSPYFGTFQYLKRGFKNQPTDYYFRTIELAIRESKVWKKSGYCVNDKLETEIMYDYLRDFARTMGDRDKRHFAFVMVSSLTHDILNYAGYCDPPTYRLLNALWDSGALNRSLLVIFSDHGLRFGEIRSTYLGKYEERMPFMYVSVPEWFQKRHPVATRNLRVNQDRLMTLFDVHATLEHLLEDVDLPHGRSQGSEDDPSAPKGLSLFGEIKDNRTCEEANILPHWCPCQVYRQVANDDKEALAAAESVAIWLNEQLHQFANVCATLEVDRLLDARIAQASDLVLRFLRHENDVLNRRVVLGEKVDTMRDFRVNLMTKPGGAMFEGSVRQHVKEKSFQVLGVSRINMYGKQSWCVDKQILKKFCFCKKQ